MIRIARILGRANVGGPARTVRALAREFSGDGFETLLIVGAAGDREGELLEEDGRCEVRRLDALRRAVSPRDLVAYRSVRRVLEEFDPHVVHTHAAKAGALSSTRSANQSRASRRSVGSTTRAWARLA